MVFLDRPVRLAIWRSERLSQKYIRRIFHHFYTDHPVYSYSESEQKQLNTWVSFQSAE